MVEEGGILDFDQKTQALHLLAKEIREKSLPMISMKNGILYNYNNYGVTTGPHMFNT